MAEQSSSTNRVLVISHDVVGQQMAGPGIRYYHLARVLASEFDVTLAIPVADTAHDFVPAEFKLLPYGSGTDLVLEQIMEQMDVIIVPAIWFVDAPKLTQISCPLVIDGYNPYLAEILALGQNNSIDLQKRLSSAYLAGDFFICASERQRDWWIGLLEAHGRINPYTFQEDSSLRKLIDLVPFGLSETPPQHTRPTIKGVWPGIGQEDKLILWGGGLWPWLDPLTAVKAIAKVHQHRPEVRLVFPGTRHPNPIHENIVSHNEATKQLAEALGLLDTVVFFGDWVPYSDWSNVLLESDVALTLHYESLETRLAFRSRIFDYIWAGLPTVATHGDATSDLLSRFNFNRLVDDGDVEGVATAILELLDSPKQQFTAEFAQARQQLTWREAARPLVEFCRNPRIAPDKVAIISKNTLIPSVTSENVGGISMDKIKQKIAHVSWYHSIDLGEGVITPGHYDHRPYLQYYGLPPDLTGKTALDIGAASGFFSFELEKRGATVTATDLPEWMAHDFGPNYQPDQTPTEGKAYLQEPFAIAKELLNSNVVKHEINIYDISPETMGKFDLIFCGSVLLHITDPIKALWRIQQVTKEVAIIATMIEPTNEERPLARFVGHHRGDGWWYPNRTGLEMMIQSAGFQGWEWFSEFRLDYRNGDEGPYHGVIHAWNTTTKPTYLSGSNHEKLQQKLVQKDAEIDRLKRLVTGYERGRFIRFMRWLKER